MHKLCEKTAQVVWEYFVSFLDNKLYLASTYVLHNSLQTNQTLQCAFLFVKWGSVQYHPKHDTESGARTLYDTSYMRAKHISW